MQNDPLLDSINDLPHHQDAPQSLIQGYTPLTHTDPTPKELSSKAWRLSHLYKISDKQGNFVTFKPNPAQLHFLKNKSYFNILLKSRQLGFTTLAVIDMLDNILFRTNFHALLISFDDDSAKDLFQKKVQFAWEHLPPTLKSKFQIDSSRSNLLRLDHGNQQYSDFKVDNTGRSGTYNHVHVCLDGDTKIIMKNGYTKKIKDIIPGEKVLTTNGYKEVRRLIKNKKEEVPYDVLKVKLFGNHSPLVITENHEVLSRNRQRRSFWNNFGAKSNPENPGNAIWRTAGQLQKGWYLGFPITEISNKLRHGSLEIDGFDSIAVNRDLGYFVGLFLAEGSMKHDKYFGQFLICCHKKEVEKFESSIKKVTATDLKHKQMGTGYSYAINISDKRLRQFIYQYFYDKNTNDKYIPDSVFNYGHEFVKGLVAGLFDGDGSYRNLNVVQLTSIRENFVIQLKRILLSLRIGCPTIYFREAGRYYGRNCKDTWVLKIMGSANSKYRRLNNLPLPKATKRNRKFWRPGKDNVWYQITDIEKLESAPEYVYDLCLDEFPHNYCTENGIVHNSEMAKIAQKFPEKVDDIIRGTFPSVHPPFGQITIESTSEGPQGEFYEMFMEAYQLPKDHNYKPKEFKAFFYNWQWDQEAIRLTAPSPYLDPEIPKEFLDIQKKHNELQLLNPQTLLPVSDQQITYYYYLWLSLKKSWKKLLLEYPLTPEDAFKSSSRNIFDLDNLTTLKQQAKNLPPPKEFRSWLLYKEIQPHHQYVIGADPSEGIGQDSTAAVVIDFSTSKPEIVATLQDKTLPPDIFAYELKTMGEYCNYALIVVERNNHGHATLSTLKGIYPPDHIYKEVQTRYEDDEETSKLGWSTNLATKPRMFYDFATALNDNLISIPSYQILKEASEFDRSELGKIRSKNDDEESTRHFDLLTATVIAFQGRTEIQNQNNQVQVIAPHTSDDLHGVI